MGAGHWHLHIRARALWLLPLLLEPALAQIRIVAPNALAKQFSGTHGMLYGTTATFGAPYYGERVFGRLLYAESRGRHCGPDDYELPKPLAEDDRPADPARFDAERTGPLVNIVLVHRGDCTFVTKVRVAQDNGAHAVIIVDHEDSKRSSEDIQRIVMADDGYGDAVRIPSILISRTDGQRLIDAVSSESVILQLAWDIPRGEVVVMDFWMSSGSGESNEFLWRFKDSAEVLRYHLQFVPHYHVFTMPKAVDSAGMCIQDNAYCAPDPDGPGPVTGADVVREDVRQLCIWETTAESGPGGARYSQPYWDYVVAFFRQCRLEGSGSSGFSQACAEKVISRIPEIPRQAVDTCQIARTDELLVDQIQEVAWSSLALRLNGWRYSGPLDPEMVLTAVCAGYNVRPHECDDLLSEWNIHWVIISGFTLPVLFWTLGLVSCSMVTGFYLYRRYVAKTLQASIREEVMMEVQSQMTDYLPLEEATNGQGRPPVVF